MSKLKHAAKAIAIAVGFSGGCTAAGTHINTPNPDPQGDPDMTTLPVHSETAQTQIAALRALDVIEVGQLLVRLPTEAICPYNVPCDGWQDDIDAEVARQMPRLRALTDITSAATQATYPESTDVAADLAKLRALEIVEIHDLIVDVPVASANCYNLVCPGDQARADSANQARRAALAQIVTKTADL
jgi:hypothetical protein